MICTNTRKIVEQFRLSSWGDVVAERIASGQTVVDFCKERGITKTTYYYRQKKVREAACAAMIQAQKAGASFVSSGIAEHSAPCSPLPPGWTQIAEVVPEPAADSGLVVEIGGCRVNVNAETDPALLAKVCGVLRTL